MLRWWPSSQVATTTAGGGGGRLEDRHMPGGRRPLGPANVSVTDDRGQDVWRTKEDLLAKQPRSTTIMLTGGYSQSKIGTFNSIKRTAHYKSQT